MINKEITCVLEGDKSYEKMFNSNEVCWGSCGREEGEEERWIGVLNRVGRESLVQKMASGQKLEVKE